MFTKETLPSYKKEDLPHLATNLTSSDIDQLVTWLSEKADQLRYKTLLTLLARSENQPDVYPYWDTFVEKLQSSDSYQRNIGLKLIAENVRWDEKGKYNEINDLYLSLCEDEKPITARQCIQGLNKIVLFNKQCHASITTKLLSLDLSQRKESMRNLLLLDILTVLVSINKMNKNEKISQYIENALNGDVLDKRARHTIQTMLET